MAGNDLCDTLSPTVAYLDIVSVIMKNKDPRSLNVRSELFNTCRHRRKFKLSLAKTVA